MRFLLYACLLLSVLARGDEWREPESAAAGADWSAIGEGFSSTAAGAAIEVTLRAHSAPSLSEWAASGLVVDRLEVAPRAIELRTGEPLPLGQLQVFAFDPEGRVIARVPLAFSLEGPAALFDFDGYRTYGSDILATGAGRATIWVESLLPAPGGGQLRVPVTVTVRP